MLLKHLKLCTYKLCLVPEINIIIIINIITIVHTYTYTYTVIHSKKKIVVLLKGNAQKHKKLAFTFVVFCDNPNANFPYDDFTHRLQIAMQLRH